MTNPMADGSSTSQPSHQRPKRSPRVEEPQEIRNGQRARCYRASEGFDQGIWPRDLTMWFDHGRSHEALLGWSNQGDNYDFTPISWDRTSLLEKIMSYLFELGHKGGGAGSKWQLFYRHVHVDLVVSYLLLISLPAWKSLIPIDYHILGMGRQCESENLVQHGQNRACPISKIVWMDETDELHGGFPWFPKKRGTPKSSILIIDFHYSHYKPSILGIIEPYVEMMNVDVATHGNFRLISDPRIAWTPRIMTSPSNRWILGQGRDQKRGRGGGGGEVGKIRNWIHWITGGFWNWKTDWQTDERNSCAWPKSSRLPAVMPCWAFFSGVLCSSRDWLAYRVVLRFPESIGKHDSTHCDSDQWS